MFASLFNISTSHVTAAHEKLEETLEIKVHSKNIYNLAHNHPLIYSNTFVGRGLGVTGKLAGLEDSSLMEDTNFEGAGAASNTVVEPITGMVLVLMLGRLGGSGVILCFGGKGDM